MKCSKEIILEMEMIKERPFGTSVIWVQGYVGTGALHPAEAGVPF